MKASLCTDSTVSPAGGSSGTEKPFSTRYLDFFFAQRERCPLSRSREWAYPKSTRDAALGNPLGECSLNINSFFVRESPMSWVQRERFAAVFAAAAFGAVAVSPKRANGFGILAMRAGKRNHATI